MTRDAAPPSSTHARGLTVALLITTFFGAIWGFVGASALPTGFSLPAIVLVAVITVALLWGCARLSRLSRRLPSWADAGTDAGANPFKNVYYRLAVLFEVLAIPLSANVLNRAGYPGAVISAVAIIVGLHFFGLIPAFKTRIYAAVGGAMVVVGLVSLLLPTGTGVSPRGAFVGLGCAVVLWVFAFPPLFTFLRRAGVRSG